MILDIFLNINLVLILVGGVYFGYRKGFLSIASTPVKFFAALLFTFYCCAPIGRALVKPLVHESVSGYVSDYLYKNCADMTAENIGSELPTVLKIAAGAADIDINEVASGAEDTGRAVTDAVADALTEPLSDFIAIIIAFIVLYFVSKILFGILIKLLNHLLKGGVLGGVNKVIGVVFGGLCGILAAWVFVAFLEFLFHSSLFANVPYVSQFEGHALYSFFKNYTPLEMLLSF